MRRALGDRQRIVGVGAGRNVAHDLGSLGRGDGAAVDQRLGAMQQPRLERMSETLAPESEQFLPPAPPCRRAARRKTDFVQHGECRLRRDPPRLEDQRQRLYGIVVGKARVDPVLKGDLPVIPVRDIAIQKRENDLAIATFGRGFYILDDYTPLRHFKKDVLEKEGQLFPVKDGLMMVLSGERSLNGSMPYTAKNPEVGAVFTYYLKDKLAPKSLKEKRKEQETELFKKGEKIPMPTPEQLKAEEQETPAYVSFTIKDSDGNIVRELRKKPSGGIQRIVWDMRYQASRPVSGVTKFDVLADAGSGIAVAPGKYNVTMSLTTGNQTKVLAGPVDFVCRTIGSSSLPVKDNKALLAFHKKVTDLSTVVRGTQTYAQELNQRTLNALQAINAMPNAVPELSAKAKGILKQLDEILNQKFDRKSDFPSYEENPPSPVTINARLGSVASALWAASSDPTQTAVDAYNILMDEFPAIYEQVKKIGETDLPELEKELNRVGAPLTPGRLPVFKKN